MNDVWFRFERPVGLALGPLLLVLLLVRPSGGALPMIGKIEPYSTDQVLIHFDVQPNTTCALQWTTQLKTNRSLVNWSNLWVSPNLPFFEHYIITDTRLGGQRFYRLQVSP